VFAGLAPDGYVLINATRDFADLGLADLSAGHDPARLLTVPASSLAMTHLGRPLPGAPMLGGLAALTAAVSLDAVLAAIIERFAGQVAAGNAAARAAFDYVIAERKELAGA
jgi:pyruvate ferredoxin oxidoreductase gamma subunit